MYPNVKWGHGHLPRAAKDVVEVYLLVVDARPLEAHVPIHAFGCMAILPEENFNAENFNAGLI